MSDKKFALLLFAAAVAIIGLALLTGCGGYVPQAKPPISPPVDTVHVPVCVPPGLVSGCWHQPPNQNWQYIPPSTTPPKPATFCPKELAPGAYIYVQSKFYGQGVDGSPRVVGDPEFCRLIHGVSVNDCHLEGWSDRFNCELELLGKTVGKAQACPEWEWAVTQTGPWTQARQNTSAPVSVDHFGNTAYRDDPQTPQFEGQPAVCGEQRDGQGDPKAGFFVIAHGQGFVRSCAPSHDPKSCGDPKQIDY